MTVLVPGDRTVPWASSLPVSRVLKPLKYEVAINRRVLPETTQPDAQISYIDIGTVDSEGRIGTSEQLTFETAPSRARRLPSSGDTIISTVRTYLRAIAFLDSVEPGTVCSTGFAVLTPGPRLHPKFLSYWLRSDFVVNEVCARSTGISYPAINALEIGNLPVPVLPVNKQRTIAGFLDRKTAAIDALIQKKERQIELLRERRRALTTHAVTKGLDPAIPMKESGVYWLGKVPAHWKVEKLRRISSRVDVGIAEAATHAYAAEGVPLIRSTNIVNSTFDLGSVLFVEPWFAQRNRSKTLHSGDIVTVRTGTPGISAVVPHELDGAQCFTTLMTTLLPGHQSRYVCEYLNSKAGRTYFELESWGSAQQNISVPILADIPVTVPPADEQRRIVDWIESEAGALDRTVNRVVRQVELLREYRQALISAAVTGKIEIPAEDAA